MKILDLSFLIKYYQKLSEIIDSNYPEEITWDNCWDYNFTFDYKHPDWVKLHFPMILLMHKEKPGKMRKGSAAMAYQNQAQVISQLICTSEDWGIHYRKNKHKGFSNIVAAIKMPKDFAYGKYGDKQKPEKFLTFGDFARIHDNESLELRALCDVLDKKYPCWGKGQTRLF